MSLNFGFISTRIKGIDGVSLEAIKWGEVLKACGHNCFWFAGELEDKFKRDGVEIKEAHFEFPEILSLNREFFSSNVRDKKLNERLYGLKVLIKDELYKFIERFNIDLLIVENALTIPMNIPLGLAITELIAETSIPTIAHHHDFFWERERYITNCVKDILDMAFPPDLPSIQHVVINRLAQRELAFRKGISSIVIPNVLNFEKPVEVDSSSELKKELGYREREPLFLQPTRIIPRKGIELSIEILSRTKVSDKLIISHKVDKDKAYFDWLKSLSSILSIKLILLEGVNDLKTLWEVYSQADIVLYPSRYEGFGNAFLEAIYFKKPIVINRYPVFISDIEPLGFRLIKIDSRVTEDCIEELKRILNNSKIREEIVEHNYRLAKRYFSYDIVYKRLSFICDTYFGLKL